MKKTKKAMKGIKRGIDVSEMIASGDNSVVVGGVLGKQRCPILKEAAPHYWVPNAIEKFPPSLYWDRFKDSKVPAPKDEGDLEGVRPWWEKYDTSNGGSRNFIPVCEAPIIKGNDPSETEYERLMRESDLGSAYPHRQPQTSRARENVKQRSTATRSISSKPKSW